MSQSVLRRLTGFTARQASAVVSLGLATVLGACSPARPGSTTATPPPIMAPPGVADAAGQGRPRTPQPGDADLTTATAAKTFATATIIDTRTHKVSPGAMPAWTGEFRRVRDVVPEHGKPPQPRDEGVNDLPLGGVLAEKRASLDGPFFPSIGQTPWGPPDPSLAVGPNHIVATVNMSIAFYTKDGAVTYANYLNTDGNPGFFEDIGGGGYTFDPKCFYDQFSGRFVVVAPEVYGSTEAWITIAVSDDSDPNGIWYKYRTNAVITVGASTFWWDYPGFGYDDKAFYVTGNLFGLNAGGWGGVGFRVFDKAAMLTGQPLTMWTLRDGGAASVQVAHHMTVPNSPYFVSVNGSTSLRVHAIRNPITAPTLVSTTVTVPAQAGPTNSPNSGGNLSPVDGRIFNAMFRSGRIVCGHTTFDGSRNVARWYEVLVNNWPAQGGLSLAQSGNVFSTPDSYTSFPAVAKNKDGDIAMAAAMTTPTTTPSVIVTGRRVTDLNGTMGAPVTAATSPVGYDGRWGDYFGMVLDPQDDTRFWYIAETAQTFGWGTWIGSFTVRGTDSPIPIPDSARLIGSPSRRIDVLANDFDTNNDTLAIDTFDVATTSGGTVARSVGTGPGGRDELLYSPPSGFLGVDRFTYRVKDPGGLTGVTNVTVTVGPGRAPDQPAGTKPGLRVDYFALATQPASMPDFSTMSPYKSDIVPAANFPYTTSAFATSGRNFKVGARFEGYIEVPDGDQYTLYASADNSAKVYIGGVLLVDNPGPNVGMVEKSGAIALGAGKHQIRADFYSWFQNGQGLIVSIQSPSMPKQAVPASMWSHFSCTGDFNDDQFVDAIDYDTFLSAWIVGNSAADVNGDEFVDAIDYDVFLVAWLAGC